MDLPEFRNQLLTDFSREENVRAMRDALHRVRSQLGGEYDLVVGSERSLTSEKIESFNPSRKHELIGIFQKANREDAEKAMQVATGAFREWSRTDPERRVEYVLAVSRLMQERRMELAGWMVYEVGKSWAEADADVAEAIDFCEFYAREMLRLAQPQPLVQAPGEENRLFYIPLGVCVILPPWNFPLAILTGMSMAAVVAGNPVIIKPSSESPATAAQLVRIVEQAGIPSGVVNFVTGGGSEVGEYLVDHPLTRMISFTGSKEVGLRINERAARHRPGQLWIKRVIAEMGGKDAIIVDAEADLDDAVTGVVASAFGYQGQKCSACSRAVVDESLYESFLQKVVDHTERTVRMGDVSEPDVNFGPVISRRAFDSIMNYIGIAKSEGRLILGGEPGDTGGYFIQPTIFADVDSKAVIAQEEIFGPVLAVIRARGFDQAIAIANDTEYGLTGSVYTTDESRIATASREFHVGNLYVNRKCTGAFVGAHPFGGFNMSGTDSKAGGRDYLLLFTQAKVVSRKLS